MVSTIFMLVRVVYSEQRAGKGCDFSKADEERLMNLSLRVDKDPAVKHDHSSDREDGCREQLYVSVVFHFECKSSIKKRSHQKMGLRSLTIDNFTALRT